MNDSMALCVLKHFLNNCEDVDVRPLVEYALKLSSSHLPVVAGFFNEENIPVPDGFKEDKDLNPNAPRLFDDGFYLIYLSFMARVGMQRYSQILSQIARGDLRGYFTQCLHESTDLYNKLADTRLQKGLYIRAPHVEVPKTVQYIESSSFLTDWFGEKRPMVMPEITHIFSNMLSNIVGRSVNTGFGQVAKTDDVIEFMFRGKDLAAKRIKIFSNILTDENIPIPSTSDAYVSDSTTPPFSEKLMMFHTVALVSTAMIDYGTAMADNMRSDLQATYVRLGAEIMKYTADGANLMIKNRWLEQPLQAINHENLVEG